MPLDHNISEIEDVLEKVVLQASDYMNQAMKPGDGNQGN